uniref:FERM domain-containing protein n=1 Tax=Strongyloides papillosus TaxID=174720 RepID=A0A0N5B2R5_STREA
MREIHVYLSWKLRETLTRNPRTLVKDLCKSVMEEYNLGHLADDFEVFVRYPNLEYYPFRTFFHDTNASVGSVAVLFEGILTIKKLISLNLFYECSTRTMTTNGVHERSSFSFRTPYFYGSNLYFFLYFLMFLCIYF